MNSYLLGVLTGLLLMGTLAWAQGWTDPYLDGPYRGISPMQLQQMQQQNGMNAQFQQWLQQQTMRPPC